MWMAVLGMVEDEMHVIPLNDLISHVVQGDCVCGPRVKYLDEGNKMFIHASLDGRELKEPNWEG